MSNNNIVYNFNKKGLEVYSEKPYYFLVSEDKKSFYYSEVGILVSATYRDKNFANPEYIEANFLNPNWSIKRADKFDVSIQYDYRQPKDFNNFAYCENTGTKSIDLFFDSLGNAIQGVLNFLDSKYFGDEKATFRDVAYYQSLHHVAAFSKHSDKPSINELIILNSEHKNTLEDYKKIYSLRSASYFKYRDKLHNKFKSIYRLDLKDFISNAYTFEIGRFLKETHLNIDDLKKGVNKNLLKKIIHLYS